MNEAASRFFEGRYDHVSYDDEDEPMAEASSSRVKRATRIEVSPLGSPGIAFYWLIVWH